MTVVDCHVVVKVMQRALQPAPASMPRPVPPNVAKMTRAVLLSSSRGVLLQRFCRDYRNLSFEAFPWRSLGYASPADMLQAMPDVVRFTFSQKDGDYKLYGMADTKVFNPSWFLKRGVLWFMPSLWAGYETIRRPVILMYFTCITLSRQQPNGGGSCRFRDQQD